MTNLAPANSYYRVISPFALHALTGFKPTNCYYGSSQIFTAAYEGIQTTVGGEIHNLHGGVFYVLPDSTREVLLDDPSNTDPFEKTHLPVCHNWPLNALRQISKADAFPVQKYSRTENNTCPD